MTATKQQDRKEANRCWALAEKLARCGHAETDADLKPQFFSDADNAHWVAILTDEGKHTRALEAWRNLDTAARDEFPKATIAYLERNAE